MVKLRLTRTGRKNYATYRVIAIDSRRSRDSKALEYLGHYLPHDKKVELNADRIKYWLSVGAQPSDTVARILVREGVLPKTALPTKKYKQEAGRKSQERATAKAEKAEAAKTAKAEPKEEVVETTEIEEKVEEVKEEKSEEVKEQEKDTNAEEEKVEEAAEKSA